MRLHQREQLEHLVERAEPARKYDGPVGVFDEHRLADEEIAEAHAEVHVFVEALFMRQLDTEAHGLAVDARRSPVRRFHDARPATGDDGHAVLRDALAGPAGRLIHGIGALSARRTENGNGRPELRQRAEPIDEFGLDAKHAPRIGMEPVRGLLRSQQVGIRVVLGNHGAAHHHGATTIRFVVGTLGALGIRLLITRSRHLPINQVVYKLIDDLLLHGCSYLKASG